MDRRIEFEKLRNTRDLGGQKVRDGRTIVSGKLFRSGALADASPADIAKLATMVDAVIDLRTENERVERPDADIPGAKNVFSPILEGIGAGVTRDKKSEAPSPFANLRNDPEAAVARMADTYRKFVRSDFGLTHYARAVRVMLEPHEKGVLWHCTAGKDRAGTTAAIVEEILGLPREEIMVNYLKTAEYIADEINAIVERISASAGGAADNEAMRRMFGTEPAYLLAFWEAIDEKFGNFDIFLHEGLGLLDEDIEKFRNKYLE